MTWWGSLVRVQSRLPIFGPVFSSEDGALSFWATRGALDILGLDAKGDVLWAVPVEAGHSSPPNVTPGHSLVSTSTASRLWLYLWRKVWYLPSPYRSTQSPESERPKLHMPNIANILKLEISRVARKEVRGETQWLKKAIATYRTEIASLKRRAKDLEDQVRQLNTAKTKANVVSDAESVTQGARFSAKALASQRRRLKLSADRLGLLIGVSGQSVYNWEQGTTAPYSKHLPAIAALKTLTVRQAAELVEARRK